jgi:hypothetical protein
MTLQPMAAINVVPLWQIAVTELLWLLGKYSCVIVDYNKMSVRNAEQVQTHLHYRAGTMLIAKFLL